MFEVYLRDKHSNGFENPLTIARSSSMNYQNSNERTKFNGFDLTPTPPVNGHATFVRHNNRRLRESLPLTNRSSPTMSIEPFSRTTNVPITSSSRTDHQDEEDVDEMNRQRYRPPSSTGSSSLVAPPIRPRKSSTTPNNSLINSSKPQQHNSHARHHVIVTRARSDGDEDEEQHSLEGHDGQSDLEDEDQTPRSDRPNSRLALRNIDDRIPYPQQPSGASFRRPQYKQAKQTNRHLMYDDYRFLDDQQQQQQQPSSASRSKQQNRSTMNKEFPHPSSNRVGSGSGNQSATNRLRSGSKSTSNEYTPALDLTVAGQKVFRTKQQADTYTSNSLPSASAMRPPSGRLKPISSAKSISSHTDDLSSSSSKTLDDVTSNVKQSSSSPIPRAHMYKKKLAPLTNSNDSINRKSSSRSSIEQQPYYVDDAPSDRSEETSTGGGGGGASGRDFRSSSGSDKRSKYH